jgi:hypothetical protein
MEHRFDLVVSRMSGHDVAGANSMGGGLQELIAERAGDGFQTLFSRHLQAARLSPSHLAGDLELPAQLGDKRLIGGRLSPAKLMVEMGGYESPAAAGSEAGHGSQQSHAIGASGYSQ